MLYKKNDVNSILLYWKDFADIIIVSILFSLIFQSMCNINFYAKYNKAAFQAYLSTSYARVHGLDIQV